MVGAAAVKLEELFDILKIDHRNDHNSRDTPRRVARMLVEETDDAAASPSRRRSPSSTTPSASTR